MPVQYATHSYYHPSHFHCFTLSSKLTFSKKCFPPLFHLSRFLSVELISRLETWLPHFFVYRFFMFLFYFFLMLVIGYVRQTKFADFLLNFSAYVMHFFTFDLIWYRHKAKGWLSSIHSATKIWLKNFKFHWQSLRF